MTRVKSRDSDSADWMKPPSPEITQSSPGVFSSLSARFCRSEFSRVRRLRKYNPQMSAGRLRYQKYPPGQLHSQGELKNWVAEQPHQSGQNPLSGAYLSV